MTKVRNPGKRASSGRVWATISCAVLTRSARGFMRITTRAVFIAAGAAGPVAEERDRALKVRVRAHEIADAAHVLVHLLVGRALRRAQADVDRVVVLVRDESLGHHPEHLRRGRRAPRRTARARRADSRSAKRQAAARTGGGTRRRRGRSTARRRPWDARAAAGCRASASATPTPARKSPPPR